MKTIFSSVVLATLSLAVSGMFAGCSASGSIDPNHDANMSSGNGSTSTVKKVEVRDANGRLVEKKTETHTSN